MTTPCERYSAHVVTPSGMTAKDPMGVLSTVYDYQEWRNLAWSMLEILSGLIDRHQAVLGASSWPEAYLSLAADWEALPTVYDVFGIPAAPGATDSDTIAMKNLAVQATCNIGEVEQELVDAGETAPPNPLRSQEPVEPSTFGSMAEDIAETVSSTGKTLALVFLAYLVFGRK